MENQNFNALIANSQPLLLVLIGLVILTGAQLVGTISDREALLNAQQGQNAPYQQSARLRAQLTGLAGQLALLADTGDTEAKAIVDNFAKQGVKFSPPANSAANK